MTRRMWTRLAPMLFAALLFAPAPAHASGFGLPSNQAGLGFGNLKRFDGVRLNLSDRGVHRVRGLNCTLWFAHKNDGSDYRGINLGLAPSGGSMRGLHVGLLGLGADKEVTGLAVAGLAVGAGNNARGIHIGGLAAGTGKDLEGIVIGGLGCGAGEDVTGIAVGGLGCGAGKNVKGLVIGGLGCGAGEDLTGIAIGGLGCGAGKDVKGLAFGGLGCGAGRDLRGIAIGGLGVGAGRRARGILVGGLRAEAHDARGILLAAHTRIRSGGRLTGFAGGLWNQVRGSQTGITIGLFNYARDLQGLQLGAINWVRSNPSWRRILPVLNW